MDIAIRPIHDVEGCLHFQELERRIWSSPPEEVPPVHMLVTVIKNGGGLLGAYAPDGPAETGGMVGAALWWLGAGRPRGADEPALKVCSHIVGVLPAWQGRQVGLRLKLAQRQAVLAQGLTDWVTWTYDPLYRVNGALNLHRLGATCSTYLRNVYGEMRDLLNAGVPSDRCQVDWRLNSPYVLHDLEQPRPQPDWELRGLHRLPSRVDDRGFRRPDEGGSLPLDGAPLAAPVPDDIAAIRARDAGLSLAWRFYLRGVFEAAFAAGYTAVDCVSTLSDGWHYILVQEYA